MGRGRRDCENCALTDVIDGWTVDAYEPDRRLRLRADLKLPGRGWLEFQVTPLDDGRRTRVRQTATPGRFDAGGRSRGTCRRFGSTANRAISNVGGASGRPSFTGHTTAERYRKGVTCACS